MTPHNVHTRLLTLIEGQSDMERLLQLYDQSAAMFLGVVRRPSGLLLREGVSVLMCFNAQRLKTERILCIGTLASSKAIPPPWNGYLGRNGNGCCKLEGPQFIPQWQILHAEFQML